MIPATNTHISPVPVNPARFRPYQPKDKLSVKLTTNARQYVVVNTGYARHTSYVVTFLIASDYGKKLASCTCKDFATIKLHGMQCKHIRATYNVHVARMAAAAKAATA